MSLVFTSINFNNFITVFDSFGRLRDAAMAYFMASQVVLSIIQETYNFGEDANFSWIDICKETPFRDTTIILTWMKMNLRLFKLHIPFHKIRAQSLYYKFLSCAVPHDITESLKIGSFSGIKGKFSYIEKSLQSIIQAGKEGELFALELLTTCEEAVQAIEGTEFSIHTKSFHIIIEIIFESLQHLDASSVDMLNRRMGNLSKLIEIYSESDNDHIAINLLAFEIEGSLDYLITAIKKSITLNDKIKLTRCLNYHYRYSSERENPRLLFFISLLEALVNYDETKIDYARGLWGQLHKRDGKDFNYLTLVTKILRP